MHPRLVVQPGTPDEQTVELREGVTTVGRTKDNDAFILHKSLSRAHARLERVEGKVVLLDLGSKNGTFVDGVRIDRRELGTAHTLRFGDVTAVFESEPGARPREPAPTPTHTRNIAADLTRISMGELLGGGRGGATALNLRATTAAERDRDKLRVLLKVSQVLSSPAPLDTLLASVLDLAFEILDIDRAAILMVDQASGNLVPRIVRARGATPSPDLAYSKSIARYVRDNSVAALFSDATADPRLAHAGSVLSQSIRTSMCAPLRPRDEVLGVLYVDNLTRPDRFDESDLEFLSAFSNQAAVAIENALLVAKLADEAVTRNNLLRFFPPAAVPLIMKEGGARLAPVETEATVLFSDISGYTEMSSRMRPIDVIAVLNAYFPVMAEIVFRHGGTLEKYIGDALLAVWGAPIRHEDDPARAVRAAVDMQRAAQELRAEGGAASALEIHVGVNTGPVAAGNIGSADYIQYATIGDATNVASRICGVARPGEIVIDARTADRLPSGLPTVSLGPVALKGKTAPMTLFRVEWAERA